MRVCEHKIKNKNRKEKEVTEWRHEQEISKKQSGATLRSSVITTRYKQNTEI